MRVNSVKQRWVVAGLLAVCAGVAVFLFLASAKSHVWQPFLAVANKTENAPAITEIPFVDTDADGLTDAEELKLGTDPKNPDTDSDDYLDGEEVSQATDPRAAASLPAAPSLKSLAYGPDQNLSHAFVGAVLNDLAENDRLFYTEATGTGEVMLHAEYDAGSVESVAESFLKEFYENPDITNLRSIPDEDLVIMHNADAKAVDAYLVRLMAIVSNEAALKEIKDFYAELQKSDVR